jgi:hypothetical protein
MTELRQSKSPDFDEIVVVHLLKFDSLFRSGAVSVRFFDCIEVGSVHKCPLPTVFHIFGHMCIIILDLRTDHKM